MSKYRRNLIGNIVIALMVIVIIGLALLETSIIFEPSVDIYPIRNSPRVVKPAMKIPPEKLDNVYVNYVLFTGVVFDAGRYGEKNPKDIVYEISPDEGRRRFVVWTNNGIETLQPFLNERVKKIRHHEEGKFYWGLY